MMISDKWPRRLLIGVAVLAVALAAGVIFSYGASAPGPYEQAQALNTQLGVIEGEVRTAHAKAGALEAALKPKEEPTGKEQTTWAPASATQVPLSDTAAAGAVIHTAETRPDNAPFNTYVPTDAELAAFHSASSSFSPLSKYVDGRDGLTNPSTDDLIQWAAAKWGIPVNWLRSEYVIESNSHQLDCTSSSHACEPSGGPAGTAVGGRGFGDCAASGEGPAAAVHAPGCASGVYTSVGITQVKEQSCCHPGTFPLAWKSTAFNVDYQASILRYYFDGLATWTSFNYKGQEWASIGAWFSPGSNDAGAQNYQHEVQGVLARRGWPGAA